MKNDIKVRRSKFYEFTINGPTDSIGYFKLMLLKRSVANNNRKPHLPKMRVCVKGRLGRNNAAHGHLYHKGGPRSWALASGSVLMKHASRFDVYVYNAAQSYNY